MVTTETLEDLLEKGYAEECPVCGGIGVYSWQDEDEAAGIKHIGTCGAWEWQCPHCRTYLADDAAPAPCACPACGEGKGAYLGQLGSLHWWRCVDCGGQWSEEDN